MKESPEDKCGTVIAQLDQLLSERMEFLRINERTGMTLLWNVFQGYPCY
jgi:hypothetical protein